MLKMVVVAAKFIPFINVSSNIVRLFNPHRLQSFNKVFFYEKLVSLISFQQRNVNFFQYYYVNYKHCDGGGGGRNKL